MNSPKNDKPYFGRQSITTNCLSTYGFQIMEDCLRSLERRFPNMTYCPILPRLVQLLLWYVPRETAVGIVTVLINETLSPSNPSCKKFICDTPDKTRMVIKQALGPLGHLGHKRNAQKIVREVIENLFVDVVTTEVISMQKIPIILVGYLVLGLDFLAALAGEIYSEIKDNQNPKIDDLIASCKGLVIHDKLYRVFAASENYHPSIYSSIGAISDILLNFTPRFDRPVKIFTDDEQVIFMQKQSVLGVIPKIIQLGVINLAFSIELDGLVINDLYEAWNQECLASFLVIKYWKCLIGVYFDRSLPLMKKNLKKSECFIFKYDTDISTFYHVAGKALDFSFEENKGIFIGNKQ